MYLTEMKSAGLKVLVCLLFPLASIAQDVTVEIKFSVNKGKYDQSKIIIAKDGAVVKTIDPAKSRATEKLAFGHDYMLTFEKPGYITKRIAITTKNVPKEVQQDDLDFDFAVEIFQQYEGVNTVVFNQPVAKYFYDAKEDGFAYDTDYTKSIRSAMVAFEKEYAKQEQQQKTDKQDANANADEEQRKAAQAKAAEEQRKAAEAKAAEEQRKAEELQRQAALKEDEQRKAAALKAEEDARLAAQKKADDDRREADRLRQEEERRAQQLKAEEDARRTMEAKGAEEDRILRMKQEEEARKAATLRAEEEARNAGMRAEEDERKRAAAAKADEDARRAMQAKADEEARKAQSAKAAEDQRLAQMKAKEDEEKRRRAAAMASGADAPIAKNNPKGQSDQKPMAPKDAGSIVSRTEDKFREDRKEITQVTIQREFQTYVYRMVKHDWGGVYYFKNDISITKFDFDTESNAKK
jgi:hypothetical protein